MWPRRCCVAEPLREPVSWLAIELIEARLRAVTREAGYHTDLGVGTVSTDPAEKASADSAMHTLIDAGDFTEIPKGSTRNIKNFDMAVTIEVFVPFSDDQNAALQAHRARADVVRALSGDMQRNEAEVRVIEITGSGLGLGVSADGAAVVIAQVTARAGLTENNPPASS